MMEMESGAEASVRACVRASFNGTGLSCDPYACGDALVDGACSSLSDFYPMTDL
jgi:hypothetical protein